MAGSELMNQALCPTWLGGAESRGKGGIISWVSFVESRTGFIHKGVVSAWLGDVALGGKWMVNNTSQPCEHKTQGY